MGKSSPRFTGGAERLCFKVTVISEMFARILFSRIALKDIFATLNIHD